MHNVKPRSGIIVAVFSIMVFLFSTTSSFAATSNTAMPSAAASITGTIYTPSQSPLGGVLVVAEEMVDEGASTAMLPNKKFSARAGTDGTYRLAVPAGRYVVKAFASPTLGFINPPEVEGVEVAVAETRSNLHFWFRASDVRVIGTVREGQASASAFVSAWSEEGGYAETETDAAGTYALKLTKREVWRVAAFKDKDKTVFRSSETRVFTTVDSDVVRQDLILLNTGKTLPDPASKTTAADRDAVVGIREGAQIRMPKNAVPGTEQLTITVTPDHKTPSQRNVRAVGIGYRVEMRGANARTISSFAKNLTVSLPFNNTELSREGLTPQQLQLAFWDETAGMWEMVPDFSIDTVNRVVIGSVNHLTRFALIAPADTQPPDPPYNVSVLVVQGAKLVRWNNPVYDFHHAKIYRSKTAGTLGTVLKDYITDAVFTDAGAPAAAFYTVRIIDLAGNESQNITQYSTSGPVTIPSQRELGPTATQAPTATLVPTPSAAPTPSASPRETGSVEPVPSPSAQSQQVTAVPSLTPQPSQPVNEPSQQEEGNFIMNALKRLFAFIKGIFS